MLKRQECGSSRMRTARLLPVSPSMHFLLVGGQVGVPTRGVYLPGGSTCPGGVTALGGVPARGVPAQCTPPREQND